MMHTGGMVLQWFALGLMVTFFISLRWFRTATYPRARTHGLRARRKAARRCRPLNPQHARFCRECGNKL